MKGKIMAENTTILETVKHICVTIEVLFKREKDFECFPTSDADSPLECKYKDKEFNIKYIGSCQEKYLFEVSDKNQHILVLEISWDEFRPCAESIDNMDYLNMFYDDGRRNFIKQLNKFLD